METIKPKFIEKNASTEPAEDFELLVAEYVARDCLVHREVLDLQDGQGRTSEVA